jgi:tetratricopeptide (TPR) repeat protein
VDKAIEINQAYPDALILSATLLRKQKKFQEAERRLLKAKEITRDTVPQIHWDLALIYGNDLKRYADAARELQAFLKAQPDAKDAENIRKKIAEFEAKAAKP